MLYSALSHKERWLSGLRRRSRKSLWGQPHRGFKSLSLRHFFAKKMAERRRKSSLHCAKHNFTQNRRFSSLPRRNAMKPGHLHQTPEKTYLWRRFIPLSLHFTCEEVGLRRPWSFLPSGVLIVFPFYCATLTRRRCRLEFYFCHAILNSERRSSYWRIDAILHMPMIDKLLHINYPLVFSAWQIGLWMICYLRCLCKNIR